MAVSRRSPLEHRSNRLKLTIRKKPYFDQIPGVRGVLLGYRRTKDNGTWVVRVTKDGGDWTKGIGKADDHDEAKDDPGILTYEEAQDEAKKIAKAGRPVGENTVKAALDRYEADLEDRGGDPKNVVRTRMHLTDKLANKAVGSLTKVDLKGWRDGLIKAKMKPITVNRTMTALRAALNLAAEDAGGRITNREAWKSGLKAFEGASKARNVILDEQDVIAIVGAAYRESDEFGLLVELAAVTGARPSQLLRLQGEDVKAGFVDPKSKRRQPRLMMPVSRKGRGKKKITHRPVPIPESLAERLKGRTGTLLKRPGRDSWAKTNLPHRFEEATKDLALSQPRVTIYALRHTSIVRQLLAGVPIRVVAALHDTSVLMIERNYSEYIADHADELARPTLLETIAEVITLRPEGKSS
ncbi:MAG TPA: site-specific integrase [Xanthobacteraceae bacterium]|nr:site-specific integrase [Xanthobacteraceae bacterium]